MKLTNTRVVGACIIVCASIVSTSSSFADTETLSACVKKSNGATRIISGKMKCAKTERLVTWTSTSDSLIGPAGATGATGATGSPGAKGERGLTGPVGLTGAAGVNGLNGTNGRDGVDGTNGVDGINGTNGIDGVQGAQGEQGLTGATGATGATGPSGISKALVASGNQVSINQGSEATVLSATIPAGKYVMSLSASLNYSNGNTSMVGHQTLGCFVTTAASYLDAIVTPEHNLWPTINNSTPYKVNFEAQAAYDSEIMRKSFADTSVLELSSSTSINWVCQHISSVANDPNEKVIIRYPRIVLTAVDQLVTLN